ncbi:hypothetical protein ACKC6T_22130 [Klebsiella quasipneumoniae subsp. quasipneumoniae]
MHIIFPHSGNKKGARAGAFALRVPVPYALDYKLFCYFSDVKS